MQKLNYELIGDNKLPERVLQFGEGNFLRAFIDWMLHRMNKAGEFNGRAVVVQPLEKGLVDLLNEQDGLYTLYLRGIEQGQTVNQQELITSLSRGINPYTDWTAYLQTAKNPDMRLVVSNTTEAGIAYVKTKPPDDKCPSSFPAKLTAWLAARYNAFGGSSESGMVFMPCELINYNGTRLKEFILLHAEDWELGEGFTSWIEQECIFLNTLVDRIVPGYPRDEAEGMQDELGYADQLICAAEIFHLFVVEGPESLEKEFPFHKAGLNVVWCPDMQRYRTRKVSILNGAHTASVLAAFLAGLDTVQEMVEDDQFGAYVRNTVFNEIVPVLPMNRDEAAQFGAAVIERFANPFIRHELLSISLNSVSKWKVRVLPSIQNYVEQNMSVPPLLAFSMAALIAFYKGDLREGYTPNDDPAVLDFFSNGWKTDDVSGMVRRTLARRSFWGEDLTEIAGFEAAVGEALELILAKGARGAVGKLLERYDEITA